MAGLGLRELGATGLRVTSIGYGCSPLGNLYGTVKEEEAIASVHEAARLGVNYFDVSPYYGDTLAETVLGKALKTMPIPRESFVVSTKCGRYGHNGFDFSAERVTRSVDESLERLNLDYVDIMICHDIEFVSLDQVLNEAIPALQKVKETGKVRHIGISGLPLHIFRYVLDRAPKGVVELILSYCHHSLNDTSLLDLVPYLQEKGVGIISASPMCMGLLSGQGYPEWHPAPHELKVACEKAAEVCKAQGKSISHLALQYALRNRDIATTLVGMASPELVQQNVKTAIEVEHSANVDEELLNDVERILQPVKNLTWPSGREENN
jgi:L-galactose dehydrogenase